MATKEAPSTPAPNCQRGNFFDLTAAKIKPKPARVFFLEITIKVTKIRPVEKETIAASSESPRRRDNSPLIRDWIAIKTPDSADKSSSPTLCSSLYFFLI
jgi:hypothetical protein